MKTILAPTDFSLASNNAIAYAAGLAGALHTRLILFHSYMIPTPISEVPYMLVSADDARKEIEEKMSREVARINISLNGVIEVEGMVRIGIPTDEIRAAAEEKRADLVVIAATSGVPANYGFPTLSIPSETLFTPIIRATYATDFGYTRNPGLFDPLMTLLKSFGSVLDILHVNGEVKENGYADSGATEQEVLGKTELATIFQEFSPAFNTVRDASVIRGIKAFTRLHSSDLLVMVAHKHGLFERLFGKSSTREMAHQTNLPLLVLQG